LLNKLLTFSLVVSVFLVSAPGGYAQTAIEGWSEPINISNSGSGYDPSLIVDMNGTFHVIWFDLFDGYKYAKSDDGVTWTKPINVKFPFSPPKTSDSTFSIEDIVQPRFLVDPNGPIHIFWLDKKNNLYHSRTLPGQLGNPTAWNGATILSESVLDFDTQIDDSGDVHLAFLKNNGIDIDPAGIYYRSLKGTKWSEVTKLYTSQYFRSLQPENAHVRLAVSSDTVNNDVYVVWDDLAQKRILMSASANSGGNWGDAYVVVSLDEKSGSEAPHDVEINIVGNNILLTWQTGQETKRCVQNSRVSNDGITWGDTLTLFRDLGICPANAGFYTVNDEYSLNLFKIQNDLALVAWNGNQWSDIQIQSELSTLQNPVTLDQILLGCQQISLYNNILYVVGCDEGNSQDIWFTSRVIGSVSNWFPSPSAWGLPSVITRMSDRILSVSSTVDEENNIHAVWTSQSTSEDRNTKNAINYAVWNNFEWSPSVQILVNLDGIPNQLALGSDTMGRLLLVWVDETNQNLMFSWANSHKANIPLEWNSPLVLTVPGKLVSSPGLLTDGADNIVVVYAVPYNESRGVYMIRSDDHGDSWSTPSQVFDAISAGWDAIDQPSVAISGDGRLHVLFNKLSFENDFRSTGLYYSRSDDGGITWSDPIEISNGETSGSHLIAYDSRTLHLIWQERIDDAISVYYRISTDNGQTWSGPINVASSNGKLVVNTPTMDAGGQLHLLEVTSDETLSVQDRGKVSSLWKLQESVDWTNELNVVNLQSFHAGVTPNGYLYGIVFVEANGPNGSPDNRLMSFGRFIDGVAPEQVNKPSTLPTPAPTLIIMDTPEPHQLAPTAFPLADISDTPTSNAKNVIGIVMMAAVFVLMIFIIKPRRPR